LLTFGGSEILDSVHHEKAGWNFSLTSKSSLEYYRSVGYRRMPDVFVKQAAERTQTLEADFEADVGHRQPAGRQQLLRLLDSTLGEVLMGSLVKCLAEEPQEVKPRQARLAGDLVQIKRKVIALIDELSRTYESLICLDCERSIRLYLVLVFHLNYPTSIVYELADHLRRSWPKPLQHAIQRRRTGHLAYNQLPWLRQMLSSASQGRQLKLLCLGRRTRRYLPSSLRLHNASHSGRRAGGH
jgi:hypothetical protein